jgi:leader peptidase (prepilin peptidase) / N-methyltransferase
VSLILSMPLEVRLAAVFVVGAWLGGAANWAIYRLAWNPRPISPWSWPHPSAPRRRVWDRLPILGWLGLRREANLHRARFWVRPMVLELLTGIGLAWLYWWEVQASGLLPPELPRPLPGELLTALHLQFAAHALLITLMLAASMIDVDEMIIPDEITVPGTLVGLLLAAACPWSLLPDVMVDAGGQIDLGILHLASPNPWPASLDGYPVRESLAWGLACWWLWCVALLPRTWYERHGWLRAIGLSWARVVREPSTYRILRMAVMGTLAIALVWYRGGLGWTALLPALVGMAAGGLMIWLVRIVGTAVLRREAMGFGDVTLMAMIGAYLGWQPCLVIFFLAPFAGLVVGLFRLLLFRDREIPYGPFLCLATLVLIVRWEQIWSSVQAIFALGSAVVLLMLGCLVLMAVMLGTWRLILRAFR